MPKPDNTPNTDTLAATIRELEQVNADLAQRVEELTSEAEAHAATIAERDATIARLLTAAEQRERDVEGARYRVREVEGKLAAVEAQRDEFQRDRDAGRRENEGFLREIEGLHDELRRRSTGRAPLALDITALLDLHRISGNDRYLVTARRLGDELAAQHDASDLG